MDDDTILYRITSLEGFLSLVLNRQERFVRPIDCWEDTFEGYMLHLLDSDEGIQRIIGQLYEISGKDIEATIHNFAKMQRSRYACYGICWTRLRDSDAMWRIYSYDKKAIQIVSSKKRISEMLELASLDKKTFEIKTVSYDIEDEQSAINRILNRSSPVDAAYFHKRPAFKHEEEVRVLIHDVKMYRNAEEFSVQAIKAKYQNTDISKSPTKRLYDAISAGKTREEYLKLGGKERMISINDLDSYISGIRVHPQAPKWYVEVIEKLCAEFKLSFEGKSDLYRAVVKKE